MDLSTLPSLTETVKIARLSSKKSLGQHFLLDQHFIDSIVQHAGDLNGKTVIEVGVGPGGLTRSLLQAGANVIALEKDARCIDALQPLQALAQDKLTLIECDALKQPIADLAKEHGFERCHIIANLPYNIATLLTYNWLDETNYIESMLLMYQLEVGQRITAEAHSKAYGKLSVWCQLLSNNYIAKTIPPESFDPPPRVDSAMVSFTPHIPAPKLPAALKEVLNAAFNKRRKMLRASLKGLCSEAQLLEAGIEPTQRPEEITPQQFLSLAKLIH